MLDTTEGMTGMESDVSSLSDDERKAKNAAYKREWRKNNPEKEKLNRQQSNARYRAKHFEKAKADNAKWYQAHREEDMARRKALYHANKEIEQAKQKIYRDANKDKIRAYRLANAEMVRDRNRVRRARVRKVRIVPYRESDVLARYGTDCHICGKPIDLTAPRKVGVEGWENGLHIEHLIPISRGGEDSLENVKPSHGLCNLKKHY